MHYKLCCILCCAKSRIPYNNTMKPVEVAIYCRVSTILNQDVSNQLIGLRRLASERGYQIYAEYIDEGISGRSDKRPSLDRLLIDARNKKFQIVLTHAIDRLSRSTKHLLNVLDLLNSNGVSLISVRENLDFTTPYGQLALTMIAAMAQLESELIRERIRTALAIKKDIAASTNNGWRCGRPSISKEVEDQVLQLKQLGLSIRAISKKLNGVSKSSVSRILKERLSQKP